MISTLNWAERACRRPRHPGRLRHRLRKDQLLQRYPYAFAHGGGPFPVLSAFSDDFSSFSSSLAAFAAGLLFPLHAAAEAAGLLCFGPPAQGGRPFAR